MHISAGLEEGDLKDIITGPAQRVGLQFEEGLVEVICKDVMETTVEGDRAGLSTVLPLLEFALTELWMRRKEGYLTHDAYTAIGGVTGSLTQWADQAYQGLAGEELGDVAHRILTELVSLGDERQGCRIADGGGLWMNLSKIRKRRIRFTRFLAVWPTPGWSPPPLTRRAIRRLSRSSTTPDPDLARLRQWLKEDRSFYPGTGRLRRRPPPGRMESEMMAGCCAVWI